MKSSMNRLRAAREAARLSQPELAQRIGISDALLRELEAGRAKPSPRVAQLLRDAFGEPAALLLTPIRVLPALPDLRGSEET